jgi:hypothetical protein
LSEVGTGSHKEDAPEQEALAPRESEKQNRRQHNDQYRDQRVRANVFAGQTAIDMKDMTKQSRNQDCG